MASMASSFTRGGRAGCSGFRPMPLAQRASSSDAASMENRANTTLVVVESPTKAKKVQKFLTKPDKEEDERSGPGQLQKVYFSRKSFAGCSPSSGVTGAAP